MNFNVITDLYGNIIKKDMDVNIENKLDNNNLPFILIHTSQPQLLLQKISTDNAADGIWRINIPTVEHILYNNQINPDSFAPLGDIWLNATDLPNRITILLVNTDPAISLYPIDFGK